MKPNHEPFFVTCTAGKHATRPLARPHGRLALSLRLAGISLRRCRFASDTRANAPSGASNHRFQVYGGPLP